MKEITVGFPQESCVYEFAESLRGADYPLTAIVVNHAPIKLVYPALSLDVAPYGGTELVELKSYDQLHGLLHNFHALAEINGWQKLAVITIDSDDEQPEQQPKKRGRKPKDQTTIIEVQ